MGLIVSHGEIKRTDFSCKFYIASWELLYDVLIPRGENSQNINKDKVWGLILWSWTISRGKNLQKLLKLNPYKAPGPDGMHPRVLKETADVISAPLAQIFTKSIKEGTVPDDWKVAHVTAIFKKGKQTSPWNYRPVRLTSIQGCSYSGRWHSDLEPTNANKQFKL